MDCGRCGSWLESKSPDGLFNEDEEIVCDECCTTNQVGCEEGEPYEGGPAYTAYVSNWTCKHGADEDTPCPACDAEDAAAEEGSPRG